MRTRKAVAIMQDYIGRHLHENETIWHKNGDEKDNRIENMVLMTKSQHMSIVARRRPSIFSRADTKNMFSNKYMYPRQFEVYEEMKKYTTADLYKNHADTYVEDLANEQNSEQVNSYIQPYSNPGRFLSLSREQRSYVDRVFSSNHLPHRRFEILSSDNLTSRTDSNP